MNYLEAWNAGFDEGKKLPLKLINDHCAMEFESMAEVIKYIRQIEFQKKGEVENV